MSNIIRDRKHAAAPSAVRMPKPLVPLLQRVGAVAAAELVAVYAVGGCVRDWLLGLDRIADLDFIVEGNGLAFAEALGRAFGASVVRHEQFGTASFVVEPDALVPFRVHIDVATCRQETYAQPAAYPKVRPGRLREDLFRRDFTINAMAMRLEPDRFGALVDPFGGLRDLRHRRLRVLHAKSFLDDPSRMLRGVRFAQRYGCRIESRTAAWLRQAIRARVLAKLNRGRMRKEIDRLAAEPNPSAGFQRLGSWLSGRVV